MSETVWMKMKPRIRKNANNSVDSSKKIVMIPLGQILPNPSQPRRSFDEVGIVSLADSIRQHGLLQPISVRRSIKCEEDESRFYCIAGERRLRAFKMLGKEEIPCIIADYSPSESAELAIIENVMREDLNIFEYAEALATLIDKYEITQEALAQKMSTSQSNIANKLRLLRFSPKERALIIESGLTERHARSLLRIHDSEFRFQVLEFVIDKGFTVKDCEKYIDSLLIPTKREKKTRDLPTADDFCRSIDKTLAHIRKKGLNALGERVETETEIKFLITIQK